MAETMDATSVVKQHRVQIRERFMRGVGVCRGINAG
jgi:hypothetical protein